MRKLVCLLISVACVLTAKAVHIKGGWIQYQYLGAAPGDSSNYKITVTVFRDCVKSGPMPGSLVIYDASTKSAVKTITGTASAYSLQVTASKTTFSPCLSGDKSVCYQIYTYTTTVALPNNPNGYIIAASDANRITGIVNVTNSSTTGITFTASIPGTISGADYHVNSSPFFEFKDTAIVCYQAPFSYQFTATDADNDSLSYAFGPGLNGGPTIVAPPYYSLSYTAGFYGEQPLGSGVTIDPVTGLITGTAPSKIGEYVIAVYVTEWRGGVAINTTKKELQIKIGDCSLSAAALKPVYLNCSNFSFSFQNESASSIVTGYNWDFGVAGTSTDTSTSPTPAYTYADTGAYTIKLKVSSTSGCTDSATAVAKAYPGFHAGFVSTGSCFMNPFTFKDTSYARYGAVNSWTWTFGEGTGLDTSTQRNPAWLYSAAGPRTVSLIATSTKGCADTLARVVNVKATPSLSLPFHDTLICSIDTLKLQAVSDSGSHYSWAPGKNIFDTTTATPSVFPKDTTIYTVTVSNNGCTTADTIRVNVLQYISVDAGNDTAICQTDTFHLRPVSYALSYVWTASTGALIDSVKYPPVRPLTTTEYYVIANLGKCQARDSVKVTVSPYPVAQAAPDTTICYGDKVKFRTTIVGNSFTWTPASSLSNPQSQTPVAGPLQTTTYILTVRDTLGCGKAVSDTVLVKVAPLPSVAAGHDTIAVIMQPVQLQASSSVPSGNYTWSPATGLSSTTIYNPVATLGNNIDSVKYFVSVTDANGCSAKDSIRVKVFKTGAEIFVANAFTPNGDGRNDILHAIPVGLSSFEYFQIYSRWGELLFQSSDPGKGWDGTKDGQKQLSGTYIFVVKGVDYSGKSVLRKGTVVLIR